MPTTDPEFLELVDNLLRQHAWRETQERALATAIALGYSTAVAATAATTKGRFQHEIRRLIPPTRTPEPPAAQRRANRQAALFGFGGGR